MIRSNDGQIPASSVTRRSFLQAAASAGALACAAGEAQVNAQETTKPKKRIAAVNSVYRMRSHAYHIAGRFVHGYRVEGFHHQPNFTMARMYNDQYPADDLCRALAKKHGFQIADTPEAAVGGPEQVDVDGVLLIVEHGDYPLNEFGQILYPRYALFQKVVEVFRKAGKSAPVFVDKHLSYDHRQAAEMVETARKMGFGLMAGSSLPVTWRRPHLEPPIGTPMGEALVCHAGGPEIYGCHGLETLQVMMERRSPRERGMKSVRMLEGPAVWQAGDDGLWSKELLQAALSRSPSRNYGDPRDNVEKPYAILVEYLDGARGAALNLAEHVSDITFAARIDGQETPISTLFELPAPPGANFFDPLTWNIEQFFETGKAPYPVERTLLTSTALDLAMRSKKAGGRVESSPFLHVEYMPPKSSGCFRGRTTEAG